MKTKNLLLCAASLLLSLSLLSCDTETPVTEDTGTAAETAETAGTETEAAPEDPAADGVIYYSEYGAAGDGVTNDTVALTRAHNKANSTGCTVKADEGAVYLLEPSASSIVIKTDTDWTGAKFIIDDSSITYEGHPAQNVPAFSVEPSLTRLYLNPGSLSKGDTNIGVEPGVNCLVYLQYSGTKHYIRYGANADSGKNQQEMILVDAAGNVDPSTPIEWDYPAVESCYAVPVDEEPITIQGGEFVTIANELDPVDHYISVNRHIQVTRSNTTLKDMKHTIEQTKDYRSAYAGFFNVMRCNNVRIENCEIMCHEPSYFTNASGQKVGLGSYEFLATLTNGLTYVDCVQTNLFDENGNLISDGLMGTNYCRNISMIGCTVARFDAHSGLHNLTIRGCTLERINAIGFGTILVEDTTIYDRYIINLREDYGSMFGGDVILRNVNMVRENTSRFAIFNGAWVNHDFGYDLYLPRTVTIENLNVPEGSFVTPFVSAFDGYEDVTKDTLADGSVNNNAIIVPESITVLANDGGTRFRNNLTAIPFPAVILPDGTSADSSLDPSGDFIFRTDFNEAISSANDGGFLRTTSTAVAYEGIGSYTLYDGNEVHSDMNLRQEEVTEGNLALLWTGCGNPNGASKNSNITLDVKPASGSQNIDRYAYESYKGRDFVVSFDIMPIDHGGEYKGVTTDLIRLTSFYTPKGADGSTKTYGESLLAMNSTNFTLSLPGTTGRKLPKLNVTLSTEEFTNLAIHAHVQENTYDLYVNGELAAEGITLIGLNEKNKIGTYDEDGTLVLSTAENPMEDYCLSYVRLCNTNGWTIPGDLFWLDNVEMYYSETYPAGE